MAEPELLLDCEIIILTHVFCEGWKTFSDFICIYVDL